MRIDFSRDHVALPTTGSRWPGLAVAVLLAVAPPVAAGPGTPERLTPVPFPKVHIDDAFWGPRVATNRKATVEANLRQCEVTGRVRNFAVAGKLVPGKHVGELYNDSDVYKVLEGIAYTLADRRDAVLEKRADEIIDQIAAAQQPDGYLNTYFTLVKPRERWQNIQYGHELYCAGHLIEAAVAYEQATGKRKLLDVARRFADHIAGVFGPERKHDAPGHEELELALVKLYGATGGRKYLDLARFFIDQRGRADGRRLFGEYAQDHKPVREQTEVTGHAVRAMYLYSGMADVGALTGDRGLLGALDRIWHDVVDRKMYVTGGIGPSAANEGFTVPYDLPNDSAYCETCAAVGMALWNHRMFLLSGDGKYADVLEREVYNGLLSGVSLAGDRFFYVNPLGSKGGHHRVPWFDCSCCPTNIVRYLPAMGERVYAHRGNGVWTVLYVGSVATVPLEGGTVKLTQKTRYPWEGDVEITVEPEKSFAFDLHLRVPGWCHAEPVITVNGERVRGDPVHRVGAKEGPMNRVTTNAKEDPMNRVTTNHDPMNRVTTNHDPMNRVTTNGAPGAGEGGEAVKGYVTIRRTWKRGDVVRLGMLMPVERVKADPRVKADVGRVALQVGPVVYCLEGADNHGRVRNLCLPPYTGMTYRFEKDLLGGVVVIRGRALAVSLGRDDKLDTRPIDFTAVPYYAWDNRQPGEMVVWLPERPELAELPGQDGVLSGGVRVRASHVFANDTLTALNDGVLPKSSGDHGLPRMTWWDHRGGTEWVSYRFPKPRQVGGSGVYWFDDTGRGACRVPAEWRLLWRDGDEWKPVELTGGTSYGTAVDCFNKVSFKPVSTRELRLEVKLKEGFSGGILEWTVEPSR